MKRWRIPATMAMLAAVLVYGLLDDWRNQPVPRVTSGANRFGDDMTLASGTGAASPAAGGLLSSGRKSLPSSEHSLRD